MTPFLGPKTRFVLFLGPTHCNISFRRVTSVWQTIRCVDGKLADKNALFWIWKPTSTPHKVEMGHVGAAPGSCRPQASTLKQNVHRSQNQDRSSLFTSAASLLSKLVQFSKQKQVDLLSLSVQGLVDAAAWLDFFAARMWQRSPWQQVCVSAVSPQEAAARGEQHKLFPRLQENNPS